MFHLTELKGNLVFKYIYRIPAYKNTWIKLALSIDKRGSLTRILIKVTFSEGHNNGNSCQYNTE